MAPLCKGSCFCLQKLRGCYCEVYKTRTGNKGTETLLLIFRISVNNNFGDTMEELPQKAKAVMGIYGAVATLTQSSVAFFRFNKDDFIVIFVALFIVAAVGSYVYIVLFFRHYRYYICDGVIIIKKGALFKRRHLIYVDKISTITIHESFVHRWFKLCTIYFHAQGSVIRLSFVPIEKSVSLQKILDSRN